VAAVEKIVTECIKKFCGLVGSTHVIRSSFHLLIPLYVHRSTLSRVLLGW